jgi:hypothetical protein
MSPRTRPALAALIALVLTSALPGITAAGEVRLVGSVLRLDPSDRDARDFGRPGWGGGVTAKLPLADTEHLFAVTGGLEVVNLLARTKKFVDPLTGLRIEQNTTQTYGRLALGAEFGPHGNGLLQPYAGADVALVFYNIATTVSIPDDFDYEDSINQRLRDESKAAFGWSATAGVVLDFGRWGVDAGVRFLEQYGVPQQLGAESVAIQPSYLQYRLGLTFDLPRD